MRVGGELGPGEELAPGEMGEGRRGGSEAGSEEKRSTRHCKLPPLSDVPASPDDLSDVPHQTFPIRPDRSRNTMHKSYVLWQSAMSGSIPTEMCHDR